VKLNLFVAISGISLAVLPYLFSALGAGSLALGSLCGILLAIFLGILIDARLQSSSYLLNIIMSAVTLNILATSVYYQELPSLQQLGGALLAALLILFAGILTFFLRFISIQRLSTYTNFIVFMAIALSMASLALGINMLPFPKSILFFSEPSHFAMALTPFIIYTILANKRLHSLFIVIPVAILSLRLENLTLLLLSLVCVIILMLRFQLGILIRFVLAFAIISSFVIFSLNNQYFASRISLDSRNLSSLVYLRGFEASVASLAGPPFVGVGFLSMSLRAQSSPAADLLEQYNLGYLNKNDGGFVAAKILSEFGWPGLIGLIYSTSRSLPKLVYTLKLASQNKATKPDNIFTSCMVAVLMQLFVRGAGYLGPFLVFAALAYYFRPIFNHSISALTRK